MSNIFTFEHSPFIFSPSLNSTSTLFPSIFIPEIKWLYLPSIFISCILNCFSIKSFACMISLIIYCSIFSSVEKAHISSSKLLVEKFSILFFTFPFICFIWPIPIRYSKLSHPDKSILLIELKGSMIIFFKLSFSMIILSAYSSSTCKSVKIIFCAEFHLFIYLSISLHSKLSSQMFLHLLRFKCSSSKLHPKKTSEK